MLDFSKPLIMGIVNITPDSFSDGGDFLQDQRALDHIAKLKSDGADIVDIGAESTFGPEASVSAYEEWTRLEPILSGMNYQETFVSLDTWKAEVADRALELGVQMINDVTALRGDEQMIETLLKHSPYICLMYSADDTPYASRSDHQYDDVMKTVKEFLSEQSQKLLDAGFPKEKIIVDPGLGFFLSSDPAVSWEVIERLEELKELGFPILIGPSMKSFLGGEIAERGGSTVEASRQCLEHGASIIRVHDVAAHVKDEGIQAMRT